MGTNGMMDSFLKTLTPVLRATATQRIPGPLRRERGNDVFSYPLPERERVAL
jgi:hypothetical protein